MDGTHDAVRERLLAEHPELRDEYERLKPRYAVVAGIAGARHRLSLAQTQLAERTGPAQDAAGRLESGEPGRGGGDAPAR